MGVFEDVGGISPFGARRGRDLVREVGPVRRGLGKVQGFGRARCWRNGAEVSPVGGHLFSGRSSGEVGRAFLRSGVIFFQPVPTEKWVERFSAGEGARDAWRNPARIAMGVGRVGPLAVGRLRSTFGRPVGRGGRKSGHTIWTLRVLRGQEVLRTVGLGVFALEGIRQA